MPVNPYALDPTEVAGVQNQATTAAHLASSPALRELQRRRASLGREYKWGKAEVDPAYQRFVEEQRYNLGQTMLANELARDNSMQDYDISERNLSQALSEQRRRTEQDMARRGLWQSGVLSKAYGGLQGKYLQSLGDVENSRYNRLQDIQRTGDLAQQRAVFELSDAQRAKAGQLAKLLQAYQGNLRDVDVQQQGITEEEGMRASTLYQQYLQQAFQNALAGREQGLSEAQFHHNAYWAKANTDEDRRRYEIAQALAAAQRGA